jgi:hypothetical protein
VITCKVIKELNQKEESEIHELIEISHYSYAINQLPSFLKLFNEKSELLYTLVYDNAFLVGFAGVLERNNEGVIRFGPVCLDENLLNVTEQICNGLKKYRLSQLFIQLPNIDDKSYLSLLKHLGNSQGRIKTLSEQETWVTGRVPIKNKDEDQLMQHVKRNMRYEIRKAMKMGLECRIIENEQDIIHFAKMYEKLFDKRGVDQLFTDCKKSFVKLYEELKQNNNGFFYGAYLEEGKLVGGAIILVHGSTATYKIGATDFEQRKIPIMHNLLFEIIKYAEQSELEFFDLGGLYPFAEEGSQLFHLHKFKNGFQPEIIHYPRYLCIRMNTFIWFFKAIKSKLRI